MRQMVRENRVYLILFVVVWMAMLILRLFLDKGELLMAIGERHSNGFNLFFSLATRFAEEIAFLILAIVFLFIRYKNAIAIGVTGILVMIVSNILKQIFAAERPFLYYRNRGMEEQYNLIEGIEPYVGLTSFPSGHTMAGFALMTLLSFYVKNRWLDLLLLLLALLVGLSRIYLGHHFLEDVILGSLIGVGLAMLTFLLFEKWKIPKLERSILSKSSKV